MKQIILKKGQAVLQEIPAPIAQEGEVIVEVAYSLISAGTESAALQRSGMSLPQRALAQRERVQQVVDYARDRGVGTTISMVRAKLEAGSKPGYSASGYVVMVGKEVNNFQVGDRVACAGAGLAVHAEIIAVPRNLVVTVPEDCSLKDAASTTVGAIALQGVRRADLRLGETVAVVGLGLLGQITVQLLKASGCQVVGIDTDPNRVELAKQLGADMAIEPDEAIINKLVHFSGGYGVDATIITAASKSDAIVQQAMHITRKKGRVIVVGDVGLGLQRSPFYEKEIDFFISTSYGPGRYDPAYEEQGLDYPQAYVRWTENRNMQAYLELLATKKIDLSQILTNEFSLDQAEEAFASLQADGERPLGILLSYPITSEKTERQQKLHPANYLNYPHKTDKLNVAVFGASGFARGTHLPALKSIKDVTIRAVVTGKGTNAVEVGHQFNAGYVSTDYRYVLADKGVDMVVISTRHNLHAEMTIAAAQAGKAIFLEKPMALNQNELDEIVQVLKETSVPFMVGFNRRFSPAIQQLKTLISQRSTPLVAFYRVNAGLLPPNHWVNTAEGGGRIIGEACHMLDTFRYLVGAPVVSVAVQTISPPNDQLLTNDNFSVSLTYADGSLCTLIYTAIGAKALPKEYLELHNEGVSYIVDNFRALQVIGGSGGWQGGQDKGHKAEMSAFINYVRRGGEPPISLDEMVEVTRETLNIQQSLLTTLKL
ncbi:bi-domain-containing oxidoreductase [Anaerolineales bacterium HSG24]|nr:bi-domain-containing oxidoreductase [Anaerolineales bacterium HSG24]